MPVFQTQKRVNVPADLAYIVAADVAAYDQFLPLMQRSRVMGTKRRLPDGEAFDAELAIAYAKLGLKESFVSSVVTNDLSRTVTAISTDGPFRRVETTWKITPAPSGAEVAIRIDYAFRNPLLQLVAGGLIEMAIAKVMSAFEARARSLLTEGNARQQS